jgi:hypothetical protein
VSREFIIPFTLIVILSGACAARQGELPPLAVEPFSGHVTTTPDGTWFVPCGSAAGSQRWWVTFVDASVRQAADAKKAGFLTINQRTFVRWRASRTDERLTGPGGPALLVRDIFEIRAPSANDCGVVPYATRERSHTAQRR